MTEDKKRMDDNVVYIGTKPMMNYVNAIQMQTIGSAKEIIVKARGKSISRAVDVVQVVVNRLLKGQIEIKEIKIGSEEFEYEDERTKAKKKINVSNMDIVLNIIRKA